MCLLAHSDESYHWIQESSPSFALNILIIDKHHENDFKSKIRLCEYRFEQSLYRNAFPVKFLYKLRGRFSLQIFCNIIFTEQLSLDWHESHLTKSFKTLVPMKSHVWARLYAPQFFNKLIYDLRSKHNLDYSIRKALELVSRATILASEICRCYWIIDKSLLQWLKYIGYHKLRI